MFIARCQNCGIIYYGCALRYMPELSCTCCSSPLVIINSGNEATDRVYDDNVENPLPSKLGIPAREA